jgi:hypothetical protein
MTYADFYSILPKLLITLNLIYHILPKSKKKLFSIFLGFRQEHDRFADVSDVC